MDNLLRAERDSIVTLGLLARAHFLFDRPIPVGDGTPTHFAGLNIHSCVIDNADGEVLALDRNSIHADQSPLHHGEQRALRTAIARVAEKRPRPSSITIETYYRTLMFMSGGDKSGDFLRLGCSLYNTLDPCPMCASTLHVVRMKRVAYLLPDEKFAGVWRHLKDKYYASDLSTHEQVELGGYDAGVISPTRTLLADLDTKVAQLRATGVRDTHLLDHCGNELQRAADLLRGLSAADLTTAGDDKARNARTLTDLKRACNYPV